MRIPFIDTHTGGEPTRVVYDLPVQLRAQTASGLRSELMQEHDYLRRAIGGEPRGNDVIVAAYLLPPITPGALSTVIFVNNVGYLGMCGHGTIGVAAALRHRDQLEDGPFLLDTPAGLVKVDLQGHTAQIENVPSYRAEKDVPLQLADGRTLHGDVAWGGNWFFICHDHGLDLKLDNLESLLKFCKEVRRCLTAQGVFGTHGAEIDHIELTGPPSTPSVADARNFVLCPGGQFDRSPCGTGTSAKIACLAADGKLVPNQIYRQESIIGSVFHASYEHDVERSALHAGLPAIRPKISGQAYVTADGSLWLDDADPFRHGF